jgi:hypothetical protein
MAGSQILTLSKAKVINYQPNSKKYFEFSNRMKQEG